GLLDPRPRLDDLDRAVQARVGDGATNLLDAEVHPEPGQVDDATGRGDRTLHIGERAGEDQVVAAHDHAARGQPRQLEQVRVVDAGEDLVVGALDGEPMLNGVILHYSCLPPCRPGFECATPPAPCWRPARARLRGALAP